MTRAMIVEENFVIQYQMIQRASWYDTEYISIKSIEKAREIFKSDALNETREEGVRYRIILRQVFETDLDYDSVGA